VSRGSGDCNSQGPRFETAMVSGSVMSIGVSAKKPGGKVVLFRRPLTINEQLGLHCRTRLTSSVMADLSRVSQGFRQ
jgi:hypothetical protein